jgi:phenol/toluene 2-monooxygenase (NADH) P0/A0
MSKNLKLHAGIEGQRYVRVTKVLRDKYVEFEFAIDDPTINVELVLPFEHFREFCEVNNAEHLSAEQEAAVEFDKLKWRFGVPGLTDEKSSSVTSQEKT